MINNNDFNGTKFNGKKVKGRETIHLPNGMKVEFDGDYNLNKPYSGTIKKYDIHNHLIVKGGFLCLDGHPTYDKRNYHGKIIEYKDGEKYHEGTYEHFGAERTIPTGVHRYYHPYGKLKRIETYNK